MKSERAFRSPTGRIVRVRNGFSWPAILFGPMWAFVKRSRRPFFALLVAMAPTGSPT